ncbi:group II intron reverse transcriptase/maturase [Ureibacillus chungkukjangi]|uniref:group II intron reverse transcriptase/maturase n=1 Tax=Ureibacillus chungkukjangi TaxID=1202712 RepID=UPI00203C07F1|nr:group II intron reverse transcriptase/maturase [Ureibacillus chungkukjangi]MCM3389984.1 group II intron reverse transcriptase/maturase [Ureibacillus chungkukjangi]
MKFKEEENNLKNKKLRHAEYYVMQETFDELHNKSSKGMNFKNLMDIITSKDNITLAYRNIKRNNGSPTPGADGITIQNIEEIELATFIEIIRKKFNHYVPRTVKRVDIPKPNGKLRPLGIPSIWDRITQQCILQVLEPICEAKFNKHSYGFRPNRSAENAFADASQRINSTNMQYVVDVDIQGFFDEVNHTKLMRQIWTMGIRDKQLLVIIRKILKAPIKLPDGQVVIPVKGTPQGGILSPLLANINLNEFDWWIANQWEERNLKEITPQYRSDGRRNRKNENVKLRKSTRLKEIYLVRYADDFKIFCRTRIEAVKTFHACKKWLQDRLKLPISVEKSGITNLKRNHSEFLGFTMKMKQKGRTPKGEKKYVIESHISPKTLNRIHEQLKAQIIKIQHSPRSHQTLAEMNKYNSIVNGIHNYYQIATHVAIDVSKIGRTIQKVMVNRLRGISKNGKYEGENKGILDYMKSKMVRYHMNYPMVPIAYVKHKNPMNKKSSINKYTVEGRKLIHKDLEVVPKWKIDWLRLNPVLNKRVTVEYADNRISKFVAQNGKCFITGNELELNEIHCHHINPLKKEKNDSYNNLVIVSTAIHKLIHATEPNIARKQLKKFNLTNEQTVKLDKLRNKLGLIKINELLSTQQ